MNRKTSIFNTKIEYARYSQNHSNCPCQDKHIMFGGSLTSSSNLNFTCEDQVYVHLMNETIIDTISTIYVLQIVLQSFFEYDFHWHVSANLIESVQIVQYNWNICSICVVICQNMKRNSSFTIQHVMDSPSYASK